MGIRQVTLVTIAVCDLCGASETHASSSGSPDAAQHFTGLGWALITGRIVVRRSILDDEPAALCPKCAPVLSRATVPASKVA